MAQPPVELYRDAQHACLMFSDLIEENGQAVQAYGLVPIAFSLQ